jgi:F-box domain
MPRKPSKPKTSSNATARAKPKQPTETIKDHGDNESLSQPTPDAQRCLICELPNEVLHTIFSFIPFGDDVKYIENRKKILAKQVMVLRNVSRRFRSVTNESDWWGNLASDDVEWIDLIPERGHKRKPHSRIERRKFFDTLFADEYLCSRVGRICEGWSFGCPELARVVAERISVEDVDWVTLPTSLGYSLPDCLARLRPFVNISELDIFQNPYKPVNIDLDLIASAFQHLSILQLAVGKRFHGSLQHLSTLKSLSLFVEDQHLLREFIPTASASSLNKLAIRICTKEPEENVASELAKLVNIRKLALYPFVVRIHNSVNFEPLTSLKVEIAAILTRRFVEALESRDMRHLRKLDLTILQDNIAYNVEEYMYFCNVVIEYLTAQFPSFQILRLTAGLDLRLAPRFARLPNLRRLHWNVTPDLYFPDGCQGHPRYELFEEHPGLLFEEVFREFKNPPLVEISVEELHREHLKRVEIV